MKFAKQHFLALGLLLARPALCVESLEAWDEYKKHLVAKHLDGDATESEDSLTHARSKTRDDSSELAGFINEEQMGKLEADDPRLKRAIAFLTGKKQEFYCKNVGLVEIKAQHKDGTESHVVLVNQRREMDDSYAWVKDGSWTYELTNGYRPTTRSDLWMIASSPTSYSMKENRKLNSDKPDTGDYMHSWSLTDSEQHTSIHTKGKVLEPFPMYMANDFHIWGGNPSLGRLIDFRVGFEKSRTFPERGFGYKILLKSKQTVSRQLSELEVTDSSGSSTAYSDCFQVDYDIQFESLGKARD
ncbi:MAG: hypothetical protein AB7T49_14615 [Oligoflexales bacterium]